MLTSLTIKQSNLFLSKKVIFKLLNRIEDQTFQRDDSEINTKEIRKKFEETQDLTYPQHYMKKILHRNRSRKKSFLFYIFNLQEIRRYAIKFYVSSDFVMPISSK